MEEIMLKLSQFHHNHLPSGVKKLAKFIRRGFPVLGFFQVYVHIFFKGDIFIGNI